jgi:hypothetical protein
MSETETTARSDAERIGAEVRALLTPVHTGLEALRDEIVEAFRGADAAGRAVVESDLLDLPGFFAAHGLIGDVAVGVGFVGAPGAVNGQDRYILWWQRRGDGFARLRLNFEPDSVDVYDYHEMDWYKVAAESSRPVLYGPYVDYSGSGHYVFTGAVPVRSDRFVGIVGADLSVTEMERRLTGLLRTVGLDALVVTGERRVLAANTPRWVVGSKLRTPPAADGSTDGFLAVVPVGLDTDWSVAVAAPE